MLVYYLSHLQCNFVSVCVHYQDLCSVSLSVSVGPQVHSGKQSPALSSAFEPPTGGSLSPHSALYNQTGRETDVRALR